MILAVLGEAARCRIEVATIERLIETFGDAPIDLGDVHGTLRVPGRSPILPRRTLRFYRRKDCSSRHHDQRGPSASLRVRPLGKQQSLASGDRAQRRGVHPRSGRKFLLRADTLVHIIGGSGFGLCRNSIQLRVTHGSPSSPTEGLKISMFPGK